MRVDLSLVAGLFFHMLTQLFPAKQRSLSPKLCCSVASLVIGTTVAFKPLRRQFKVRESSHAKGVDGVRDPLQTHKLLAPQGALFALSVHRPTELELRWFSKLRGL